MAPGLKLLVYRKGWIPARDPRYQALMEQAQEAIFLVNLRSGAIREINGAFRKLFGYTSEDLAQLDLFGLVAADRDSIAHNMRKVLESGHLDIPVRRYRCKDGTLKDVEVRVLRLDGPMSGWAYVVVQDVTEQKQARQGLADLRKALDACITMSVTDVHGVITDVNPRFCEVSGYSREELLGHTHRILNSGHHSQAFFKDMWDTILAGRIWRGEVRNKAKDGSYYWVDAAIIPMLDEAGKPRAFVSLRTVITEKKLAEETLRHTQKLESLGLLAGGLAHDFNNLLQVILGNLSLVEPRSQPIEHMERAVARASELTHQMLAYAGKGVLTLRTLDLNHLVEEMTALLRASISKKVNLDFRLQEGLPPFTGDAAQMEQVVMNLVVNAADAIGDREGRIRVSTGYRMMTEEDLRIGFPGQPLEPGPCLLLEVADNGCGIPPEVMHRIFDPFFTTKAKGRGLGLSAMLGILRSHRGAIRIYSEVGMGTTFRVLVPAGGCAMDRAEAVPAATEWQGQGPVLVVDDDAEVRATTCRLLTRLGFEPEEAADGWEALALLGSRTPRLVILDLTMPHLDGQETLGILRERHPELPVLLCSGFHGDPAAWATGPAAFLGKPFDFKGLRKAVRELLEG